MLTKTPRNGKNGKGRNNGKKQPEIAVLPKINNTTDTRDILAHGSQGVTSAKLPNVVAEDTWDLYKVLLR